MLLLAAPPDPASPGVLDNATDSAVAAPAAMATTAVAASAGTRADSRCHYARHVRGSQYMGAWVVVLPNLLVN